MTSECPMTNVQMTGAESRRDSVIQPRVASNELPWVNRQNEFNPERVVAGGACKNRRRCNAFAVTVYSVAQVSNLLYRGFPIRSPWAELVAWNPITLCRLEVGDTAGWKPALHVMRSVVRGLVIGNWSFVGHWSLVIGHFSAPVLSPS